MKHLAMRIVNRLSLLRYDDRGVETAEVLLWMALSVAAIVLLSESLFGVLGGLVETVQENLP